MKFKVGDSVVRFQESVMRYDEDHPDRFVIDKIIPSKGNGDCFFPKKGHGTFGKDLRLATKLERVLK